MARVSYVEKDQAHPMVRDLYQKNEAKSGRIINLWKVMGHCPYIGLNFQRLGNAILTGEELSPKLRELAILRVGHLAQSKYEFTQHTAIALRCGVTQAQIDDIPNWADSKLFDTLERNVLAYTDEVAWSVSVSDETFASLRSMLSEHAIVELTAAIGYYGMVCRILVALQVDLEPAA